MAHARARLTPLGRQLMVDRVERLGYAPAQVAAMMGVSRATAYKWLGRFRREGVSGLLDRSSRPHRCPHALGETLVAAVLAARQDSRQGPHRLAAELGLSRSSIYRVLRRNGVSRLTDFDRPTSLPIRYVREHPGELVHIDIKELGRIRPGGGHRVLGRPAAPPGKARYGKDFIHVAVDDHTRLAFIQVLPDQRGDSCGSFLAAAVEFFAEHGIHVQRVMTDHALAYTRSTAFPATLKQFGIRHKLIWPYRPQTNGKAERFIRMLLNECAYGRAYTSNEQRVAALHDWLHFYNHRRPHGGLGGLTPCAVNNAAKNYS